MSVTLKIGPYFLGDGKISPKVLEVSGNTIGECLSQYMTKEPIFRERALDDRGDPQVTTGIFINQVPISSLPFKAEVRDGDEISIVYTTPGC